MTAPPTRAPGAALEVADLTVEFAMRDATATVVDGVGFTVEPGEIVGMVGESGCGKSITMLALLNLVPPPGRMVRGRVSFGGRDLSGLDSRALRRVRGREVALIPSDAGAALNPVVRIGPQVEEGLTAHGDRAGRKERHGRVVEALRRVRLPLPEQRMRRYPHELSGGMQQRVAIAMGVQLGPGLLIADEPTTALDVTIQAQILALLLDIRERSGTSILFVTHDMTTVAEICDRVLVMYAGRIVERGPVVEVCGSPLHPYTRALLDAVPPLGGEPPAALATIPGIPPDPRDWPPGCRFAPRCPLRAALGNPAACTESMPELAEPSPGRAVACHFAGTSTAAGATPAPAADHDDPARGGAS